MESEAKLRSFLEMYFESEPTDQRKRLSNYIAAHKALFQLQVAVSRFLT